MTLMCPVEVRLPKSAVLLAWVLTSVAARGQGCLFSSLPLSSAMHSRLRLSCARRTCHKVPPAV